MNRLDRLAQRRVDPILTEASLVNEVYKRMTQTDSVKYAIGAMQPIDPTYTRNTFAQGDRVKNQLKERLTQPCDYEYQGSTDTDTHIMARSDIDLLMIRTGWVWNEPPQVTANPYAGDPVADMRQLRKDAAGALNSAFYAATLDQSRPRALKLSGGSLTREVDVVPASWFDTNDYARTREKMYRGIKVFDNDTGAFIPNTPFLHKRQIELRDQETRSGLRKAIRLMKTLRYDSEGRVRMSSYDICGIAYNIPADKLTVQRPRELAILEACFEYCQHLQWNTMARESIRVPNGSRTVFGGSDGTTLSELTALTKELSDLRSEILRENVHSLRSLIEANVPYTGEVLEYR